MAYARVHCDVTDLADRNATKTLKTQNICKHYEYSKIGMEIQIDSQCLIRARFTCQEIEKKNIFGCIV